MKKLLITFIITILCSTVFAQNRQAILKVMSDQQTAWNKGDIDGFMQGYWQSDSLVFVGKTTPQYGWQTATDRYKKSYPDKTAMGQLAFTVIKLEILDKNNAFIIGGWHLARNAGALSGYFTLWFKKINGEWKIVCDHTS